MMPKHNENERMNTLSILRLCQLLIWHMGLNIHRDVLWISPLASSEIIASPLCTVNRGRQRPRGGHSYLRCKPSWNRRRWPRSEPWCRSWRRQPASRELWPLETQQYVRRKARNMSRTLTAAGCYPKNKRSYTIVLLSNLSHSKIKRFISKCWIIL